MQEITIKPVSSRIRLRDVWIHSTLIRVVAGRDLKARYKQSLLGPLWIVFQPMALLVAYIVGFRGVTHINTGHVPYVVFALAGVTLWSYFQTVATAGAACILSNGALVTQTACPRIIFPIASLFSAITSLLVPLVAAVIAAAAAGVISFRWLLLPLPVIWLFVIVTGFVGITSAITVRFRDMLQALPLLLQVGAFIAPVGYPVDTLSTKLRIIVSLNPLTGVLEAWRWALLDEAHPYMLSMYLSLGIGALVALYGWRVFGRAEVKMADVI